MGLAVAVGKGKSKGKRRTRTRAKARATARACAVSGLLPTLAAQKARVEGGAPGLLADLLRMVKKHKAGVAAGCGGRTISST